jgi:predicted RNA-binding Zn ribbon-like protein
LNFTATVGERWRRSFERLREPADLARWIHEAGLGQPPSTLSADDLSEARLLREALYRTFSAVRTGSRPRRSDVRAINGWAVQPGIDVTLHQDRGQLHRVSGVADASRVLADLARDGVDLLGGPEAQRIRECARPDCSLLFLDTSRAGRRRWCSMDGCGARNKMATYRSRPQT